MRWSICVIVSLVHAGTRGENNKKQSALGEYTTPLNFRGTATPLLTRPRRLPTAAARGGGGGRRAGHPPGCADGQWEEPQYALLEVARVCVPPPPPSDFLLIFSYSAERPAPARPLGSCLPFRPSLPPPFPPPARLLFCPLCHSTPWGRLRARPRVLDGGGGSDP